mmetsp:Transcript_22343/g.61297  ORF Transcript_22343/g.61297 Transcript_22343/m.61297 type:complete len:209 (-) Transcript_22343:203-829(-)
MRVKDSRSTCSTTQSIMRDLPRLQREWPRVPSVPLLPVGWTHTSMHSKLRGDPWSCLRKATARRQLQMRVRPTAASTWARLGDRPPSLQKIASKRWRCSSTLNWAWRPCGKSKLRIFLPSLWWTTKATISSRSGHTEDSNFFAINYRGHRHTLYWRAVSERLVCMRSLIRTALCERGGGGLHCITMSKQGKVLRVGGIARSPLYIPDR